MRVEAGAYFKKGDVLTSANGYQFIYDGLITKGVMGSICGMVTSGDIVFDYIKTWTNVYNGDKNRYVRKAIEEEKKFLAEKIIKAEDMNPYILFKTSKFGNIKVRFPKDEDMDAELLVLDQLFDVE